MHASLMFHSGAGIPGDHPHLEGTGDVARYLKINDLAHAEELEKELVSSVKAWCDMKDKEQRS